LILDLRSNPGGLVPAAIAICDMFLAKGQRIVAVQGRSGEMAQQYDATGGEKFPDIPMVVLVNGGSASASEIVAAALQDHRRATVIGERTWGKGTIQTVIPLRGGLGILKLTTAGYLRPNNHNIHRRPDAKEEDQWGVTPDDGYVVTMTADDWRRWTKWRADRDIVPRHDADPPASPPSDSDALENDLPLERAIQCIEATIASRSATRVSA
jgi:carboxyl-terminal processing protease